ncbi:MAG TPA: hypothetical protein VK826_16770 [Bacteroidia bacterium]|nr:hypothetical protein [Bacteroidia bacterium]
MGIIREPKNIDLLVGPSRMSKKDMAAMDKLVKQVKSNKKRRIANQKVRIGKGKKAA